jgi:hypothetical protein
VTRSPQDKHQCCPFSRLLAAPAIEISHHLAPVPINCIPTPKRPSEIRWQYTTRARVRRSPTRDRIIRRSFSSLGRCVRTRTPSEHTFSVKVRSVADGSWGVEISTGTTIRVRFSSLPDRTGMCEMTFQTSLGFVVPGWAAQKCPQELRLPQSNKRTATSFKVCGRGTKRFLLRRVKITATCRIQPSKANPSHGNP